MSVTSSSESEISSVENSRLHGCVTPSSSGGCLTFVNYTACRALRYTQYHSLMDVVLCIVCLRKQRADAARRTRCTLNAECHAMTVKNSVDNYRFVMCICTQNLYYHKKKRQEMTLQVDTLQSHVQCRRSRVPGYSVVIFPTILLHRLYNFLTKI